MGEAPDAIVLVQDVARGGGARRSRRATRLAYVTQTTLSVDETGEIIAALRAPLPRRSTAPKKEDICYATSNRQWAVKEMLAEIDLLLVVGSRNSSNSNRLVDVARAGGVPSHLIDDETEIDETLARRRRDRRHHLGRLGAGEARRAACCEWFRARGVDRHRAVPPGRRGRRRSASRSSSAASWRSPDATLDRSSPRARVVSASPPLASSDVASVSAVIRSANASRSASAPGSSEADPVGDREAGLLAERADSVDQVVDAPLEPQLVVEAPSSSATVTPSSDATAQPSRPTRSTSTSSGSSSWPSTRKRPSPSSSNGPRRAPRAPSRSALPSFGPSTGRFGLTRSSDASTVAELDLLHAQLLGDLVGVRLGRARRPATTSRRSGWRSFRPEVERARRPRSTTRRTSAISSSSARVRLRAPPASRRGRPTPARPRTLAHEVLPEVLGRNGITGATTRSACTSAYQSVRNAASSLLPEAPARAADVPVREVVDERLEGADHVDRQRRLVRVGRLARRAASRARDEPAVERLARAGGPPSRSASVGREAGSMFAYWTRNATEFQSVSSFRLISCAGPKPKSRFAVGRLRAVLPAHHVGAHALERVLGVDHVPPRAVHLAARARRASSRSRAPA